MKKLTFLYCIVLSICLTTQIFSQKTASDHQTFLLGNLENLDINSEYFKALSSKIKATDGTYTVLINGDFVGPSGLSSPPKPEETNRIDALLSLGSKKGKVVFIPGDKEWDDSGDDGKKKLAALEKYLENKAGKGEVFFPRNSCLGPDLIDLNDHLQVLTINSQWILQDKRQEEEDGKCGFLNDIELWGELSDLLANNENKNLIVAIHHPIISYGQYAGYKLGSTHLSPPIYGTFKASFHKNIGGAKDLQNKKLKAFRKRLCKIADEEDGIIFTSGHEYDLQIIESEGNYHINSGSLVESRPVAKREETLFSKNAKGLIQLNFKGDGEVIASALVMTHGDLKNAYSQKLFSSPCKTNKQDFIPFNPSFNPCAEMKADLSNINIPEKGTAIASTDYKKGPGKLYRSTWELPIKDVPYLDIGTYEGGLTIYKAGGAGETSSVKFKTKDGRKIAFRSVDKNPQTRFTDELENSVVGRITKDLIAHQHPYGALAAKTFADALDLAHTDPKLYIMPDDPRLGVYQEKFAGMLGTLETKPYGKKKGRPGYKGADDIQSTFEMHEKLLNDKDAKFDQESYVNARLLDMWLGDWDRHDDNWAWLVYENDDETLYKAFPKDKDKVFGVLDGIYKVIDWEMVAPQWAAFRKDYKGLKSLNYKSKDKDRWILSSFTREDWQNQVKNFQKVMDDSVIDKALSNLPPEAQAVTSADIKKVLIIRRNILSEAIDEYYEMLAKSIYVIGSNNRELFDVVRQSNGDLQITVYNISKSGKKRKVIYSRLVKESETEEVILYGLGKEDIFEISGQSNKKIDLRIVGGAGKDKITDNSKVNGGKATFVYAKNRKDEMSLGSTGKFLKTQKDITFNTQAIYNYDYALTLPILGFNADDGFIAGISYSNTKQGFGKPEFGSKTKLTARITSNLNASLGYQYIKRRIGSLWDFNLKIFGTNSDRKNQYFYGFGNETKVFTDLRSNQFYRNETKLVGTKIGLIRKFWTKSHFIPLFRADYRDSSPKPLTESDITIYDGFPKSIGQGTNALIGGDLELLLDFTDSPSFPRDGTKLLLNNYTFYNTAEGLDLGGRLDAEASLYISVGEKKSYTLGLRGGYSQTYGDTPFYEKSAIGQQSNNRGFRRNRFIGDSAAFLNTDLRIHLFNLSNSSIPLKFGIYGLYDTGRVWMDDETSNTWHNSYGGGLYIVPYTEALILNVIFARSDQKDSVFSFGIGATL